MRGELLVRFLIIAKLADESIEGKHFHMRSFHIAKLWNRSLRKTNRKRNSFSKYVCCMHLHKGTETLELSDYQFSFTVAVLTSETAVSKKSNFFQ